MKRVLFSVLTFGCVVLAALADTTTAGEPRAFNCSGSGLFSPTNIGTHKGGNAGIVIGDGSGASQYMASGEVFTIGGVPVGDGSNEHTGEALSRGTGILKDEKSLVRWPAKSGLNHVLHSEDGDIEFKYSGGFTLNLAAFIAGEPSFAADGVFVIAGGTGRFDGASGIVWVDVTVPISVPIRVPHDQRLSSVPVVSMRITRLHQREYSDHL